jgi:hypothetical protein
MTAWERTNNTKWRDLNLAGVDSIVAIPYGLETGKPYDNSKGKAAIVGFDNATGKLTPIPNPVTKELIPVNYNLATIKAALRSCSSWCRCLNERTLKRHGCVFAESAMRRLRFGTKIKRRATRARTAGLLSQVKAEFGLQLTRTRRLTTRHSQKPRSLACTGRWHCDAPHRFRARHTSSC